LEAACAAGAAFDFGAKKAAVINAKRAMLKESAKLHERILYFMFCSKSICSERPLANLLSGRDTRKPKQY
jgi:hypothetical protein